MCGEVPLDVLPAADFADDDELGLVKMGFGSIF